MPQQLLRARAVIAARTGPPWLLLALVCVGVVQAFAVGLVLHEVHSGAHEAHPISPLMHWLRDSALAVPLSIIAVVVATALARRLITSLELPSGSWAARLTWAAFGAVSYGMLSVPGNYAHAQLFGAEHGDASFVSHAVQDGSKVAFATFVLLAAIAAVSGMSFVRLRAGVQRVADIRRPSRSLASAVSFAVISAVAVGAAGQSATAQGGGSVCPDGSRNVTYDLAAFQNVIPLNGWGDKLPDGLQYALKNSDARVGKQQIVQNPNLSQPITIRANVGDCITVKVKNDIEGRRVGLNANGLLKQDPKDSDGARVGNNPDSTIPTGEERTYTFYADREGQGTIADIANMDGEDANEPTIQRGLYGAVVVHPKDSTWVNQETGENLLAEADGGYRAVESQVFAAVKNPGDGPDYRSYAMVVLDENEGVIDRKGEQPTFPTSGLADSTFGINYRSEPLRNRLRAILEHRGIKTPENPNGCSKEVWEKNHNDPSCNPKTVKLPNGQVIEPSDHFCDGYVPELGKVVEDPGAKCIGEESHLQAWPFGDEGILIRRDANGNPVKNAQGGVIIESDNLIPKAYVKDPVRFHIVHPGAKETHPWHQHTQRWHADPKNPKSPTNDVESVGPGEARELRLEKGAGGDQETIGDSIFHCHLYPHFAQGFWGHLRIFDRKRDGTEKYPDGTEIKKLVELDERQGATPNPTETNPGFPLFVKGDVGQRAYRPPNGVLKDDFAGLRRPGDAPRAPNAKEKANMPALGQSNVSADGKTNNAERPGAGFIDPCPTGVNKRVYKPHAIDTPIKYNSAGWKDPEARVYVEGEEGVAKARAGENPEPYTIRSRVGECVELQTTNDLHLDDDPNVPIDHLHKKDGVYFHEEETAEVSTHVHLVQFDELASDGTSVGWNYSQSAMPGQTFGYRWFVDQPLRTVFFHDHQYANLHQQKGLFAAMNVEPADAEWRDPKTGQPTNGVGPVADIVSPSGKDFREISVFYQDRSPMWKNDGQGDPVNPPPAVDDYGADQGGVAVNYRNEPFQIRTGPGKEGQKGDPAYVYSSAVHGDPSTPTFKAYQRDPVVVRNVIGAHEEAHGFNLHGHRWLSESDNPNSALADNQTGTLAEWFNYEPQGSQVQKGNLNNNDKFAHGSNSTANGTPMILQGGAGRPGDYLYGSNNMDDQWLGLWGIFRVPSGPVDDLKVLPDQQADGVVPDVNADGSYAALSPGQPIEGPPKGGAQVICPSSAPKRVYDVTAVTQKITYNEKTGDHDPHGVFYAPTSDVDANTTTGEAKLKPGKKPVPLFVRANAGDCVQMTLRNGLPQGGIPNHEMPAHRMFEDAPFPKSNRVSMHAGLVDYDVTRSDGATVGYNYDQTVAPGKAITYNWYVKPNSAGLSSNLVDYGDRKGHRHHGLWGGLMIEPKGATWTDPRTGASLEGTSTKTGIVGTKTAEAADIKYTDASGAKKGYREFVADFQDGLGLRDKDGKLIPEAPADIEEVYELGNRGINYRTERFKPRCDASKPASERNCEPAHVLSSQVHGDPATPVFRAYQGDPVQFRVLQGQDRGRAHTFLLNGHEWPYQYTDPNSERRSAVRALLTGGSHTFNLQGGAGGLQGATGDYLFRDGLLTNQVNAGLWGLLRVEPKTPQPDLKPLG